MGTGLRAEKPRVVVVDDEKKVADAYALRLQDVAAVSVAYDGREALDLITEGRPPDVVLLDRHMPGLSGDDVLEKIREQGIRTQVVMVTAIDPDLGVVDLPFDDYLSKPVDREDLYAAIDQQCQVLAYDLLGEYFRLESTRAVIETQLPEDTDDADDQVAEIETRLATTEARVRDLLPDADTLLDEFTGIDREPY
ncbi:response regulator [Halonotius terrestris]|uniref:Response regulator n=1 Tax=Halonotius terrestris TaxID=2487750 RepID=A0A8J8TD03_9EURY|nr:response regulator [Halonotius terrestris]TQQ82714.1 response regulator [Halonotius terrestris]